MTPRRVQRRRTKGWRMPEGAIYVGRPTRWGNPWAPGMIQELRMNSAPRPGEPVNTIGQAWRLIPISLPTVISLYRDALEDGALPVTVADVQRELAGKDLACWCPLDQPCHADVLLDIANTPRTG